MEKFSFNDISRCFCSAEELQQLQFKLSAKEEHKINRLVISFREELVEKLKELEISITEDE